MNTSGNTHGSGEEGVLESYCILWYTAVCIGYPSYRVTNLHPTGNYHTKYILTDETNHGRDQTGRQCDSLFFPSSRPTTVRHSLRLTVPSCTNPGGEFTPLVVLTGLVLVAKRTANLAKHSPELSSLPFIEGPCVIAPPIAFPRHHRVHPARQLVGSSGLGLH